MRRSEREITNREEIDDILRRAPVVHVAMVDNGEPYVVPMHFGYDGKCLYLHSAPEGRKIDVLRRNPRVSFETFVDFEYVPATEACGWSTRYRSVIGAGAASFITAREEKIKALDTLMSKVTTGPFVYTEKGMAAVTIIKVTIETISGKKLGY